MRNETANGPHVAIVAAVYAPEIVEPMITEATAVIAAAGGTVAVLHRVPGAFEIPLIAKRCIENANIDGLVVLGHIEKGETLHGEVMGHVVMTALLQMQLDTMKPIGMGIIGPGATPAQAEVRKLNAAKAAANAMLGSWKIVTDEQLL